MAKIEFVTKVGYQGNPDRIIWIPRRFRKDVEKWDKNQQVKVTIDDEI